MTNDCIDQQYNKPVVDEEVDVASPVPHRRISGHFEGTNISFNIYLHASNQKDQWQGRFFQFTYPTTFSPEQNTAKADDRAIGFALTTGGYAVQAGNGSVSLGYRHGAAAAKFAEKLAAAYYGTDREIYGYLYGPSGGSFQTVGAAENTTGVWEGFVPMVQAVPTPNSYNFNGRAAAELILSDKAADIRDALLPGGSGDPYATLDAAESAMLTEVHRLGIPWEGWENPNYLLGYDPAYFGTGLDSDSPLAYDPTYVEDFWKAPGYLGTEQTPLGERVRQELAEMGDTPGHRWNIAKRFAYRYQLPAEDAGWIALDQFRNEDGAPLYPQRAVKEPGFSGFVSGNTAFDGSINGKMIVVSNLHDVDALPIHTDWYRQRVEASLGDAADDAYRVYFNDHADHQDAPPTGERAASLVDWYGIVEQALRDLSAWVEHDEPAPASTVYTVEDAQIVLPAKANQREGLQPTVKLHGDREGLLRAEANETVKLSATIQAPVGKVVRVEWDFDGDGTYEDGPAVKQPRSTVTASTKHQFKTAGTYFVSVRVTTQRDGDRDAVHALVSNIERLRVVVSP
ncbi:PKD domain-containing protein [Herbiconiux sp. SYSU D00978]|uniref:PKD domain-containing protein n=1 Tax=Herbiconiux sp. SYSU D00978 TaxID=2812562 RepID=UPI001A97960E|nr:PKD domain-containing protein [Herbiconiux sp. SYSU D00978]